MSDFIFTQETIQKKNLYAKIKEILINSGWQNISSRPSTDFDVFYSPGEDGKKELYFQMKEFDTANQNLSTTNYRNLMFRLIKSYTPSSNTGQAGVFERNPSWANVYISTNNNVSPEAELWIRYHCNLNRLIMIIQFPPSISYLSEDTFFMIGCSDRVLGRVYPNKECMIASSYNTFNSYNYSVQITSQPDGTDNAPYLLATFHNASTAGQKTLTNDNKILFSEIAYGSANEGIRGFIDGIYSLRDSSSVPTLMRNDEFVDEEGKRYRIFDAPFTRYSSTNSPFYAYRVE